MLFTRRWPNSLRRAYSASRCNGWVLWVSAQNHTLSASVIVRLSACSITSPTVNCSKCRPAMRSSLAVATGGCHRGDELVDGHPVQCCTAFPQGDDRRGLLFAEMSTDRLREFIHQQRNPLAAPPAMADRIVDADALCRAAIGEEHLYGVADAALVALVVFAREDPILAHRHARTQRID